MKSIGVISYAACCGRLVFVAGKDENVLGLMEDADSASLEGVVKKCLSCLAAND